MSDRPLVSVVTIFFNAGPFLREAVESVFSQTYDRWELLLVDDGSTDASRDIAARYAGQFGPRVRRLEHRGHRNRGTGPSRNLGVRCCRGTHVAFLDADDVWLPQKLERQVATLQVHPEAVMIYGPPQVWYSWTGRPEDAHRDVVPLRTGVEVDTVIHPPALLPHLLRNDCVEPFPSGTLIHRSEIERVGGFEDAFRGMFEDQTLYAKVCLEAPVFVASEPWYRFRRHAGSYCTVAWNSGRYDQAWITYLEWLAEYLWKRGVRDGEPWPMLRSVLGSYRHPLAYRLARQRRRWAITARAAAKRGARLLPRAGSPPATGLRSEGQTRDRRTRRT